MTKFFRLSGTTQTDNMPCLSLQPPHTWAPPGVPRRPIGRRAPLMSHPAKEPLSGAMRVARLLDFQGAIRVWLFLCLHPQGYLVSTIKLRASRQIRLASGRHIPPPTPPRHQHSKGGSPSGPDIGSSYAFCSEDFSRRTFPGLHPPQYPHLENSLSLDVLWPKRCH